MIVRLYYALLIPKISLHYSDLDSLFCIDKALDNVSCRIFVKREVEFNSILKDKLYVKCTLTLTQKTSKTLKYAVRRFDNETKGAPGGIDVSTKNFQSRIMQFGTRSYARAGYKRTFSFPLPLPTMFGTQTPIIMGQACLN